MVIPTEQEVESLKAQVDESKVTTLATEGWNNTFRDGSVRIYVSRFEFMGVEHQVPLAYDNEFGEMTVVDLPSHYACMELVAREKLGGHEFIIVREKVAEVAVRQIAKLEVKNTYKSRN